MENELPPNWRWVPLGELLREAKAGFACGTRDPNGVIQLRMNNVDTHGNFVWDEFIRVPADQETIDHYRLLPGDVLFNTNSTELVGKSALFESHDESVVYSNHFTRLRPHSDRLLPAFLVGWLNHQWQQELFANICNRWVGQSAVKAEKLANLPFPLPPIAEQHRIAAILREKLAAVDRARAAAEARFKATKALPAAYLRRFFENSDMTNRHSCQLADIAQLLPSKSISSAGEIEVQAITTACLSEEGFRPGGVKEARMRQGEVTECRVSVGEVLIARSNTPELVGRVSMYAGNPPNVVASDLTIRIFPGPKVTSEFLTAYLSYLFLTGYWKKRSGGASGSMKKITREHVKALTIPVPPHDEQKSICKALADRMRLVNSLQAALESEKESIKTLPTTFLRRAFLGGL